MLGTHVGDGVDGGATHERNIDDDSLVDMDPRVHIILPHGTYIQITFSFCCVLCLEYHQQGGRVHLLQNNTHRAHTVCLAPNQSKLQSRFEREHP